MLPIGYEQRGITLITFEVIEPGKVTAGAVNENTEHLEKVGCDRDALFIFLHRTKLTFDDRHELNTFQIPRKQGQSGTNCDTFIGGLNSINILLVFTLKSGIISHKVLYLLGEFKFHGNYLVIH